MIFVWGGPLWSAGSSAVFVVRRLENLRDLHRVAVLELLALEHEDELAVAQEAHRWRRGPVALEVAARSIGRLDVSTGEHRRHAIGFHGIVQRQRDAWPRLPRRAAT